MRVRILALIITNSVELPEASKEYCCRYPFATDISDETLSSLPKTKIKNLLYSMHIHKK